jgi:hypothetical protein
MEARDHSRGNEGEEIKCVELGDNFTCLSTPFLSYVDTKVAIFCCRVAISSRYRNAYVIVEKQEYTSCNKLLQNVKWRLSEKNIAYKNGSPPNIQDPLGITIF